MTGRSVRAHLHELASQRLRTLFEGVSEVHLTDFPDYANVGDSALALGLLRFFADNRIRVRAVDFLRTLDIDAAVDWAGAAPGRAIVLNGGGNTGDLYPVHQRHREAVLRAATNSTVVIQAPQSAHFQDERLLTAYLRTLDECRGEVRLAVRDAATDSLLQGSVRPVLVPDSAHLLGDLTSRAADRPVVRLLRADIEQVNRAGRPPGAVDWAPDTRTTVLQMKVERRIASSPWLARTRRGHRRWEILARRRVRAGCTLLSAGEVVITDRLHGMILAIHLGRRVVHLDNTTGKLGGYAELWLPPGSAGSVRAAQSMAEAESIAHSWWQEDRS